MTTHPYDDIEAFALGGLDADAGARLLEHADQCPTCAVLLAEAMRAAAALEPPGERNLVARIFSRQPRRIAPWIGSFVAAAALIALAMWNVDLRSKIFPVPIASLVHSHFQHHELHGVAGSAKVIQALDGSWLYLVGDELAPRSTYYLWEVVGGKEREVGPFETNSGGQAAAYFESSPAKIQALVVSSTPGEPSNGGDLRWP